MDSIQTFQNTKRVINISWDVVAGSEEEAWLNMDNSSKLIRMLYPKYNNHALSSPPLIKMDFVNLVNGVVGTVDGFNYVPDLEAGVFDYNGEIFPKVVKFQCTFTCLHDHVMGYEALKKRGFPYGKADQEKREARHTTVKKQLTDAQARHVKASQNKIK